MRPRDFVRTACQLYKARYKRPLSLWGPPGVGKTDLAQQTAAKLGINYHELNLTCHDAGDLKFPLVKGDEIKWVCSLLPQDPNWKGIICFDELAQCDMPVMKATCQILLARTVGTYKLPSEAMVICTSNRQEDRAGASRVITPVLGRLYHFDLETHLDDWTEWAHGYGIDYRIISFLQYKPSLLHDFKPEKVERAFPSPRAWMYASDALNVIDVDGCRDLLLPNMESCLGKMAAPEFMAFLEVHDAMSKKYPIDKIIDDPDGVPVPRLSEGSILWALGGALTEKTRIYKDKAVDKATATKTVHSCMKYILRMPVEFAAYAIRGVVANAGTTVALTAPGASEFVKRNKSIIWAE